MLEVSCLVHIQLFTGRRTIARMILSEAADIQQHSVTHFNPPTRLLTDPLTQLDTHPPTHSLTH